MNLVIRKCGLLYVNFCQFSVLAYGLMFVKVIKTISFKAWVFDILPYLNGKWWNLSVYFYLNETCLLTNSKKFQHRWRLCIAYKDIFKKNQCRNYDWGGGRACCDTDFIKTFLKVWLAKIKKIKPI